MTTSPWFQNWTLPTPQPKAISDHPCRKCDEPMIEVKDAPGFYTCTLCNAENEDKKDTDKAARGRVPWKRPTNTKKRS